MVFSAVEYNCPCSIRYPRGNACGVPIEEDVEILPLGKGEILQDKGKCYSSNNRCWFNGKRSYGS